MTYVNEAQFTVRSSAESVAIRVDEENDMRKEETGKLEALGPLVESQREIQLRQKCGCIHQSCHQYRYWRNDLLCADLAPDKCSRRNCCDRKDVKFAVQISITNNE